jgi:hypothetical protein
MKINKSLTQHLLRQAKISKRNLGVEHSVFEPTVSYEHKDVVRRFTKIQNLI